jgi:hypothetical protein
MRLTVLTILIMSLALAGCTTKLLSPSLGLIQTAVAQTQTAIPTATARVEKVFVSPEAPKPAQPVKTKTNASVAPTVAPSQVSATERIEKLDASVYGMAYLDDYGHFLITIEVASGLKGEYYALIGEDNFQCKTLEEYPNRLYCNGKTSYGGQFVQLALFAIGSEEAVFQTDIGVPPSPDQFKVTPHQKDKPDQPDEPSPTGTPIPPYP